jgi:hypothetical protein
MRPPLNTPDAGVQDPPDAPPDAPPGDTPPQIICPPTNIQPDPSSCTYGYHTLKRATAEVVLVFDRSSAMLRAVPGAMSNRWVEMTAAIEDNLRKTHAGLRWGLKLFPSTPSAPTCTASVADGLDVPVGLSNFEPIVMRIRGSLPAMGPEGSPLDLGLKKAVMALRAMDTENPRYLILASDGIPNCPIGMPGENEAIKTLVMFEREGLKTYVIGTATPTSPQHRALNDLAAAGGEPRTGDQKYFPALNKVQMLEALDQITSRMSSCVLTVNALTPSPQFVAMNIGNTRIPLDPARREGWNWGGTPNLRVIHAYGKACDDLKANPLATAELVFGCDGHMPPPPPPCTTGASANP